MVDAKSSRPRATEEAGERRSDECSRGGEEDDGYDSEGGRDPTNGDTIRDDLNKIERHMSTRLKSLQLQRDEVDGDEEPTKSMSHNFSTLSLDFDEEEKDDDNQLLEPVKTAKRSAHVRYEALERKIEQLEKRLELYENVHRKRSSRKPSRGESDGSENQHLVEFFLTEMEKQQKVVAKMAARQQTLEEKLLESHQQTHKFHRQQLHRMTKFHEVMQMMEKEFVQVSSLREEEKQLLWGQYKKKTNALKHSLGEQIADVKTDAIQHRRRMEIKFDKKLVDLATENQLLRAENLELRDELDKLAVATRSNKRTLRILSDEVLKLKRMASPVHPVSIEGDLRQHIVSKLADGLTSKGSRSSDKR
ncbi:hypothetical protein Poli38472_003561 [Pythium oligandrum]|uniref:Uncharacterized protein n=1 Tax=Pythium oligandrum TaxID=41045 RepID=A0A8K1C6R7_PYTOL|nr:hypothetical protein Poli38472_003561 [Pythium oligandrum]|eukprot:TMW57636.1 hypothetical protein Poli38472_003561 [Pythium oligandrum]